MWVLSIIILYYIFLLQLKTPYIFSTLRKIYCIFYCILYFPKETTILNICHFIVINTIYFSQCGWGELFRHLESSETIKKKQKRLLFSMENATWTIVHTHCESHNYSKLKGHGYSRYRSELSLPIIKGKSKKYTSEQSWSKSTFFANNFFYFDYQFQK